MALQLNFNFPHKLGHLNHVFCSGSPCTRALRGCGADGPGESCAGIKPALMLQQFVPALSCTTAAVTCAGAELGNL